MFDKLLDGTGLKFEDLTHEERQTLRQWAEALSTKTLTLEDVKSFVSAQILALQRQLADLSEPETLWQWLFRRRRDMFVKARLRNYLMIQDFLSGPERAKAAIEQQLQTLKK